MLCTHSDADTYQLQIVIMSENDYFMKIIMLVLFNR